MRWIFDVFPFDMPPGPSFLAVYAALVVVALVAVRLARRAVERAGAAGIDRPAGAGPYRRAVPSQPLRVGRIPSHEEETLAVAYLRGGQDAVTLTLRAQEHAAGDSHDASETWARARDLVPTLVARLRRDGLLRTRLGAVVGALITWAAFALVIGVGAVRVVRAMDFNRPWFFLACLMLITPFVWWKGARTGAVTRAGKRYLAWLGDATQSARAAVAGGFDRHPDHVALAVAVAGTTALAGAAWAGSASFALADPGYRPPSTGGGGGGSCSSGGGSSCSGGGSSCGGGGCGGGGCGG
jgi:uncharacterized protein (TIGR04222 family)